MLPAAAPRLPWPTVATLLATRNTRWYQVGRRVRTLLTLGRATAWYPLVDRVVSRQPYLTPALIHHPILFRPLLARFLDERLSMSARFEAFAHDLSFTAARVHHAFPGFFPSGDSQRLWSDAADTFTLTLALNIESPEEGLWRLSLRDREGQPVYAACFSVVPGPRLFIGTIQGCHPATGVDPRAAIRLATRHFGGLRPPFLLLSVLSQLASVWNVPGVTGVADSHQIARRRRRTRPTTVHFSYDRYFREAAAQPDPDGNWRLQPDARARPIETVAVRKRSMYRRRAQILDDVARQIRSAFHCTEQPPAR
jgi:uncharacterized protein VirK/YbjX